MGASGRRGPCWSESPRADAAYRATFFLDQIIEFVVLVRLPLFPLQVPVSPLLTPCLIENRMGMKVTHGAVRAFLDQKLRDLGVAVADRPRQGSLAPLQTISKTRQVGG